MDSSPYTCTTNSFTRPGFRLLRLPFLPWLNWATGRKYNLASVNASDHEASKTVLSAPWIELQPFLPPSKSVAGGPRTANSVTSWQCEKFTEKYEKGALIIQHFDTVWWPAWDKDSQDAFASEYSVTMMFCSRNHCFMQHLVPYDPLKEVVGGRSGSPTNYHLLIVNI